MLLLLLLLLLGFSRGYTTGRGVPDEVSDRHMDVACARRLTMNGSMCVGAIGALCAQRLRVGNIAARQHTAGMHCYRLFVARPHGTLVSQTLAQWSDEQLVGGRAERVPLLSNQQPTIMGAAKPAATFVSFVLLFFFGLCVFRQCDSLLLLLFFNFFFSYNYSAGAKKPTYVATTLEEFQDFQGNVQAYSKSRKSELIILD